MKPIDYIYKNIDCLNTAILKQLIEDADDMGTADVVTITAAQLKQLLALLS